MKIPSKFFLVVVIIVSMIVIPAWQAQADSFGSVSVSLPSSGGDSGGDGE